jgi:hypothetical protein
MCNIQPAPVETCERIVCASARFLVYPQSIRLHTLVNTHAYLRYICHTVCVCLCTSVLHARTSTAAAAIRPLHGLCAQHHCWFPARDCRLASVAASLVARAVDRQPRTQDATQSTHVWRGKLYCVCVAGASVCLRQPSRRQCGHPALKLHHETVKAASEWPAIMTRGDQKDASHSLAAAAQNRPLGAQPSTPAVYCLLRENSNNNFKMWSAEAVTNISCLKGLHYEQSVLNEIT